MNSLNAKIAGAALLSFLAAGTAAAQTSASGDAAASIQVIAPLTVSKDADLSFGTVTKGAGMVVVAAATGARSVTGNVGLAGGTAAAAAFTFSGEPSRAITVTVPATVTLTSGANTLSVATTNTGAGSQTLSGAGSHGVKVGGSITLASDTASGNYSGTLTVSASYN
jgi:hypothetical protein